jgi:putative transcriptional regulator
MSTDTTSEAPLALRARRATGLTQTRFANLIGVERSTIQRWEHRRMNPSPHARKLLQLIVTDPEFCLRTLDQGPPLIERDPKPASPPNAPAQPSRAPLDNAEKHMWYRLRDFVGGNLGTVVPGRDLKYFVRDEEALATVLSLARKRRVELLDREEAATTDWQARDSDLGLGLVHPERGPIYAVRVLA